MATTTNTATTTTVLPVGTEIYYTGDMANSEGAFTITAHAHGGYTLTENSGEGREFRAVWPSHVGDVYNGTCSPRFVTETARKSYLSERFPA